MLSAAAGTGGATPVDLYAHPDIVPSVTAQDSSFALRVQVMAQPYDATVKQYATQQKQGTVTVKPYELPNNKGTVGVRVDGQITQTKQGSVVMLPLRDKTLKIWTESNDFRKQFDEIILANARFTP